MQGICGQGSEEAVIKSFLWNNAQLSAESKILIQNSFFPRKVYSYI